MRISYDKYSAGHPATEIIHIREGTAMTNTNMMHDPNYQQQLIHKLSHGGKFKVVFGNYPDDPEVFEFISAPGNASPLIRYINLDAHPNAKISKFLEV